ncbi:peroxidase-like [Aricia agestis]|uniref:peroxidase-like n=1 Tax=Aricia agestis TaxID=91739 RepID=UPI001C206928|nr:peroxidase-like [Aricia agestis]
MLVLLLLVGSVCAQSRYYDAYSGQPITDAQFRDHVRKNTTFWCLNEVAPCDPNEYRRLDGTCNNLRAPNRGAPHTPLVRLLAAEYDTNFEPRRSITGEDLPNPRSIRTNILAEGRVPDRYYTHLLTYFWVFISSDVLSLHDTVNYVLWKPYCCTERGRADRVCIPTSIPEDDPVHRFSNIRCMNLTRPESFQSIGCLRNDTVPERIVTATPLFDLSQVYGTSLNKSYEKARAFQGGLLKVEEEKGKIWPPSAKTPAVCVLNQLPQETRCHDTPEDAINSVLGLNVFSIWSWRMHNRLATILGRLNPCWGDEKLFYTAREIAIAMVTQMYYYELMPALFGRDNLIRTGVISQSPGFRDLYDENVIPQISLEFPYVLRWAHTIQEALLKLYDANGNEVKQAKVTDITLRTGYLVDNLEMITQGSFRQATSKPDYIVDPDMSEVGLGGLQAMSDILTNDIKKGRYFGFAPYIKYLQICSGRTYRTFEDLQNVIDPERIQLLREKYKNVEDIELMAGIWMEKHISGGRIPGTLACIMIEQMRRTIVSDRHWYERPNRPNAFTYEQLLEIRKMTMAQFMCAVGDTVTQIQPYPFFAAGPGNEMRNCVEHSTFNLWAWRDNSCNYNNYSPFTSYTL